MSNSARPNRRTTPTPTLPPVPSKPIIFVADDSFAQIENAMKLQTSDESRLEVAISISEFLAWTGSTLSKSQMDELVALAATDDARSEIFNQLNTH